MTFLTTAFLIALPLAAAPILLHLFDRRRNVVIEWGAMDFLMEAVARKTSARKLKQWILLLLRVLAIAALVLALAQPLLPGNWFGNSERAELILVVDNSMSTLRDASDDSTLFSGMIERAKEEVGDVTPGDFVRIMAASPYPVWVTAGGVRVDATSSDSVIRQFDEIRPTNGSSDLLAAMFTAVQSDAEPTTRSRRIVLLTDGQAADWKVDDEKGWKRFQESLKAAPLPTTLEVV